MTISVVVASRAGGEYLFRCLDALRSQVRDGVEVIVPDCIGGETAARIERDFPFVKLIRVAAGAQTGMPTLRALGVAAARGDILAVLEEHKVPPPGWVETIRSSFQPGDAAIGGPVLDGGYKRLSDWVIYFAEYHNYLPPWEAGPRSRLASANIAYDRRKLLSYQDLLPTGYWEVVLHPSLIKDGAFRSVPQMGVVHGGPFDFGAYLHERYQLSRLLGGTQRESASLARRLVYLTAAPLIPALLLARIAARIVNRRQFIARFIATLPLLVPITAVYVWGEWLGYLFGSKNGLERAG